MIATAKAIPDIPAGPHVESLPSLTRGDSTTRSGSGSISYPRSILLSLATSTPHNTETKRRISRRLSSFTPILRHSPTPTPADGGEPDTIIFGGGWAFDSSLLDNQPISKDLPIPPTGEKHPCDRSRTSVSRGGSYDALGQGQGQYMYPSDRLYDHSVGENERRVPILVDFQHPDPFNVNVNANANISFNKGTAREFPHDHDLDRALNESPNSLDQQIIHHLPHLPQGAQNSDLPVKSLSMNSFPKSVNSSSTSLKEFGMRLGAREDVPVLPNGETFGKVSRSNSGSSLSSQRSSSFSRDKNELNPFAPPFPLPTTTAIEKSNTTPTAGARNNGDGILQPKPIKHNNMDKTGNSGNDGKSIRFGERLPSRPNSRSISPSPSLSPSISNEASLPLPKLPSSLPQKPSPLPPVFVKRESAALPQPMSLPDIAPLGVQWTGENSLSGNEKRRRASNGNINSYSNSYCNSNGSGNGNLHAAAAAGISRGSSPLGMGRLSGSAPNSRRGSFNSITASAASSSSDATLVPGRDRLGRSGSTSGLKGDKSASGLGLARVNSRLRGDSLPRQRW
ncbi:uncharacterized protein I303_100134 [Kwoniella dejecticola CBS 10117]|uniref:Uncharacterized protein n=1 Tax=Kwoniella dejecticola CBS 10117 TaxID=1296121 RepID=A0A1A6AE72_9TREE|nr:uncharacterized protein I303_00134 [Kwoniella dejecticola CBS 10117]OBR88323.1 hypothetical protein I303_00134 [Kwoniella dejecticola CBS 10117]